MNQVQVTDIRNNVGSEVTVIHADGSVSTGPFWAFFDELLKVAMDGVNPSDNDEFAVWYFHHVTCQRGKYAPMCIFRYYDSQVKMIVKDFMPLTEFWYIFALAYPLPGW